jgi:hypothetical protein
MKNSKIEEYREVLHSQKLPAKEVDKRMAVIEGFVSFMSALDAQATAATVKEGVERYARSLIDTGQNTPENFTFLREFAGWREERKWYVALLEITDCYKALGVLADVIEKKHGQARAWIFDEALPPLGASEKERNTSTRRIMHRMAHRMNSEEARSAWFQVQHGIPASSWQEGEIEDRKKFRQCGGSIDAFLDLKRQDRDALLTRLHDENKLWYTVEIDDEVLAYAKSDPEMEVGQRQGNKIYISKIPYNAVHYLHETDPKLKRYNACHCPLLRTAILEDLEVSADACYCSLGHASHYLAGLGMELKGEVLESAVKGDSRCRFVFYLPGEDQSSGSQGLLGDA